MMTDKAHPDTRRSAYEVELKAFLRRHTGAQRRMEQAQHERDEAYQLILKWKKALQYWDATIDERCQMGEGIIERDGTFTMEWSGQEITPDTARRLIDTFTMGYTAYPGDGKLWNNDLPF